MATDHQIISADSQRRAILCDDVAELYRIDAAAL
jgi:hypothetical protein